MEILPIFRMIAGEYISIDDDEVNGWVTLAKPYVNIRRFGGLYNNAVALMAAHLMKLNKPSDDVNSPSNAVLIESYKEGETAVKYNVTQKGNMDLDAQLSLTVYGIQFKGIRDSVCIGITNAGESLP